MGFTENDAFMVYVTLLGVWQYNLEVWSYWMYFVFIHITMQGSSTPCNPERDKAAESRKWMDGYYDDYHEFCDCVY